MATKKELLKTLGQQGRGVLITSALLAMKLCKDAKETGVRVINTIKNK